MRTSLFTALSLVLLNGCGESLSAKAPKQAAPKSTDFFELTRETKGPSYEISLAYPQMICDGDAPCEAMNQVMRASFLVGYLEDKKQVGETLERWKAEGWGGYHPGLDLIHDYRCRYLSPELVSVLKKEVRDVANVFIGFHSANFWMRGERIEEIQLADLFEDEDWERQVEPIVVEHTLRASGLSSPEFVDETILSYIQRTWVERTFTFSAAGVHLHHDISSPPPSNVLTREDGYLDEVTLPLQELREFLDPEGPMARWL